jgi:hypothetical protein
LWRDLSEIVKKEELCNYNRLKSQGMTLEEVISAAPLKGLLDPKSMVPESVFIYCVYHGKGSLADKHLQ